MLFAFLGLGAIEIIILGLVCAVPLIVAVVAVVVVLVVSKGKASRRDQAPPDDRRVDE